MSRRAQPAKDGASSAARQEPRPPSRKSLLGDVIIGNEAVIRFRLDEDVDCWRWRRFGNIQVNHGDKITLVAVADQQETVHLDFVEFIPAEE